MSNNNPQHDENHQLDQQPLPSLGFDQNHFESIFNTIAPRYLLTPDSLDSQTAMNFTAFFYSQLHISINFNEVPRTGAVQLPYDALARNIPDLGLYLRTKPAIALDLMGLSVHIATVFYLNLYTISASTSGSASLNLANHVIVQDSSFLYPTVKVRVRDYPLLTSPDSIGANSVNKYVSFHATITRLSTVRPLIIELGFRCYQCEHVTTVKYNDGIYRPPASDCPHCNRGKTWVPLYQHAKSIDWQQMLVQEVIDPEQNAAGRIPTLTETELSRDLIGLHSVGDQVQVSGIVKAREGTGKSGNNGYNLYIDVCSLHVASQQSVFDPHHSALQDFNPPPPHDSQRDLDDINWDGDDNNPAEAEQRTNQQRTMARRTHQVLQDHQNHRRDFINQLIKDYPTFARIITPLYLPVDYPPIVAGGFTISPQEFRGIAYIHQQGCLPKVLVQSICPSIFGNVTAKFGILLAMLGGVDRSTISPQEAQVHKFNTFLKENNITLDSDDSFFQYNHGPSGSNQGFNDNVNVNGNSGGGGGGSRNHNDYYETHIVPDGAGGITTTAIQDNLISSGAFQSTSSSEHQQQQQQSNSLATLRTRSNIHILLIGEPGLGKSQLLQGVSSLTARGVYISGKGASTAGLTASLVKEGKGFTLQCGGVVIGDKGITCIDELDKLHSEHKALLECMEQQTVSITKAGTICQLPARTTVIAAANPKSGVYNRKYSILENLNISPILLSRFDLCFLMLDQGNQEHDKLLTDHVISNHSDSAAVASTPFSQGGPNDMTPFGTTRINKQNLDLHALYTDGTPGGAIRHSINALDTGRIGASVANPLAYQDQRHRDLQNRYFDFDIPPIPGSLEFAYHQQQYHQQQQQEQQQHHQFSDLGSSNVQLQPNGPVDQIPSYVHLLRELGFNPNQKMSQRYHMSRSELEQFESIPQHLLKKYIAFAREYVRPNLTPHAREIIKRFYLSLRLKTSQSTTGAMNNTVTTRQLESLIRLTEARAKLELRPVALPIDAYEAIETMRDTIFQSLLDHSGVVDATRAGTGKSQSVRASRKQFEAALSRAVARQGHKFFSEQDLKGIARTIVGFDATKYEQIIQALRNDGDLLQTGERGPGYLKYLGSGGLE